MIHVADIANTAEILELLYGRTDNTVIHTAMSQTPVVSGRVSQLWKHMIRPHGGTMSRHVSHEVLANMQLLAITCDLFTHWVCSATVGSTSSAADLHSNVPIKQDMCRFVEALLSTNAVEKTRMSCPRHHLFSRQPKTETADPRAPLSSKWVRILSLQSTERGPVVYFESVPHTLSCHHKYLPDWSSKCVICDWK